MESDSVLALLLGPDGAIRDRNRAGYRLLPPDSAHQGLGQKIQDHLIGPDGELIWQALIDSGRALEETGQHGETLLNLTDGGQEIASFEVALIPCGGAMLLLGTPETRHDSQFQNESLALNNELSLIAREATRKNRQLKLINENMERLASSDALTGLANRRTLNNSLQREISHASRNGNPLSVIMADLDLFKSVNDRYGHVTGDRALILAASVFGGRLWRYDIAARYGGEEFCLLLPETSIEEAVSISERIREGLAEMKIPGCPFQITASLGVAGWVNGESWDAFIGRADAALYSARRLGRNRVEVAPNTMILNPEPGMGAIK